jgi:mono/diheme cytochrome c family protein
MNRMTRLFVGLTGLLAASALTGCRGTPSADPPIHLNPNMDNVTYIQGQEGNPHFADGRGMRPQVAGTIANSSAADDNHLQEDGHKYRGKADGGWATTLPMPLTADLLDRGEQRYNIYCQPCHGQTGMENGGIVPVRAGNWLVPSLHGDRQRSYAVGQLFDIISNGINTMPSYRSQIPTEDRWAIAAYVRTLQLSHATTIETVPADVAKTQQWAK